MTTLAARLRREPREEPGRLERSALAGVLAREIINFSSYWRSTTFSSTVEPTIYLLAFGFGFGSIVSTVAGYDYVQFVGTGTVATAVLFSSIFPGDVRDVRQVPVPAHLRRDPRGAGRHRGARHRRGAVAGDARVGLRLRAAARRDVLRARPELGDADGPDHQLRRGLRVRIGWDSDRRAPQGHRELQLRDERGDHAAVPVRGNLLPDQPASGMGPGAGPVQPALPRASSSCVHAVFGWGDPLSVLWNWAFIVGFGAADVAHGDSFRWSASSSTEARRAACFRLGPLLPIPSKPWRSSSTSSRPCSCWSSSRRSRNGTSSSPAAVRPRSGIRTSRRPAADRPRAPSQGDQRGRRPARVDRRDLARRARSRATPSRSAPQRRARRARRRGAGPTRPSSAPAPPRPTAPPTTRSARASPTTRSSTATRAASPTPNGASAPSAASTSPATATTCSSGRACASSRACARCPPGRSSSSTSRTPDPGAERVQRFMTAAQHAMAEGDYALAAKRLVYARDAEPRNVAVLRLMTLAFWQGGDLDGGGPRGPRLGARRRRPPGAASLRRADLRGHGRDRPRRGGRRARRACGRRRTRTPGSASAACACG